VLSLNLSITQLEDVIPKLCDCTTDASPGYSFLKENAEILEESETRILKQFINQIGNDTNPLETVDIKNGWNIAKVKQWLVYADAFIMKLFTLVHVCGGMPARATEHEQMLLCNTYTSERSVYVCNKSVVLLQVSLLITSNSLALLKKFISKWSSRNR
jgi:hypothetical protein